MVEYLDYHTTKHRPKTHYNNLNRKLDKLQNKQQGTRKTKTKQQHIQFYPRTVNLNKMKFTHEEMSLLNKGLKHSIEKPLGKYWTDLIMEREQAIRMLEPKMQSPYRILAARKLKQIRTSSSHHNADTKRQPYILKNINNKLRKEDAMITKADKGKIVSSYTTTTTPTNYKISLITTTSKHSQKTPQINTKKISPIP
jgi:hypothetical protein